MLNQILEQAKADMFDAINEGKPTDVRNLLEAQLSTAFTAGVKKGVEEEKERVKIDENTSDGYHTFKELYIFRKIYNACLFNEWFKQGKYNIHKSTKHNDGELCFGGGWFIVMAQLPTGQISNHYELKDWDLFKCETKEVADKWDGHSAQDVATRLSDLLSELNKQER